MYDVAKIRADFPILSREVNGKPLVYLDNGASAQKPQVVIDAITQAYSHEYANVHRGLHYLSNLATDKYEAVRGTIARFLNAGSEDDIIFNSGTTEGINMVAYGWAMPRLQAGDEIVLSVMEHHANIVPWHFLRERQGVVLKWVDVDSTGALDPQTVIDAIGPKTKLVAVTHMSNVLGTHVDVKAICAGAHAKGVPVLVDGSQAAVHMPVDVQDLGVDFYAITGHKLYGPSSSGAIYVHPDRMREMQPFMGGGDMIREVTKDTVTYNDPPMKFEAGTPGIVQMIGLGVALDYMMGHGMQAIADHEATLRDYAVQRLGGLNWLQVQGTTPDKGAIFSFTLDGAAHAHDVSTILDKKGVAVRAGHHCAGPLMEHLGLTATCRASFGMYNTTQEVDALVDALELAHDLFA
ncbi:cysteine desulfurase [Pseudosulfitobacter pseudonitzschiae]|uniref:cysteine desulfurase n=1 Tax=Pseudosulfitobacter pseudonitzschiae TaxID=1402135 RepID=UPI001AF4D03C|nr:cysteine desulfurase [Pseudosulfitobacter pseudonitzschiae]MBM1814876.1 cysteine desulfurase [Pseudosulfitobacter pseudonitzschiae]MBM1831870.1 cysteine desulfurase [Pseudosulfitobacter pseudonitzschiae]MBM1836735.1 cysteine desulfurase [Pseudosulfitobacter pseudonitzschiae]MBM1841582.1 cysteine desulfurase [Pseudosulfitobacter pseudonitzschiae]MBM1846449.1 cysteine desulfurase [Pseudosulfitobacter pseudonitzschiae]